MLARIPLYLMLTPSPHGLLKFLGKTAQSIPLSHKSLFLSPFSSKRGEKGEAGEPCCQQLGLCLGEHLMCCRREQEAKLCSVSHKRSFERVVLAGIPSFPRPEGAEDFWGVHLVLKGSQFIDLKNKINLDIFFPWIFLSEVDEIHFAALSGLGRMFRPTGTVTL